MSENTKNNKNPKINKKILTNFKLSGTVSVWPLGHVC